MSKRPTTNSGAAGPRGGLAGYLRDRPIWVKLALIMIVPTIATVGVGVSALSGKISQASDADRARSLATLSSDAGQLVQDLQSERAAATVLLEAKGDAQTDALTRYKNQFDATTQAVRSYDAHRRALSGLPASFQGQLRAIDVQLGALDGLHQQVAAVNQLPLSVAIQRYQALIKSLIDLRDAESQLAGDTSLSYDLRAGSAIASAKEQLSQERVIGLQILAAGQLSPNDQKAFLTAVAGQQLSLNPFYTVATQSQQDLFNKIVTGPNLREARLYEDTIESLRPGALPAGIFNGQQWDAALAGRADLMRQVEQSIDAQTVADAGALHTRVQRQMIIEAALLIALILVAVIIAWMVARAMNRSLRELRQGALSVARQGLPQAVARLRDPSVSGGQLSPQQLAEQLAEPLPVRSKDEFGQVTEAFNAVHLEAVRTAAEQASLRSSVSTMFINLARRSQILVDRLIGHLDRLERGEEDPDRLAELFQLDHLATRMRRNDENLLVLAGADSTRVQRQPAALIDVLRAAQSEVEHYTRVEFGVVDRDIEIGAHAVNDLVHLVAELFDNATAFSPPDSTVIVEARRAGDRAVLFVEDRGIGISPEQLAELNERLATPPMVDVAVSRMMGLVVVARLAARHGVRVELRPGNERGTVADVLLPAAVMAPRGVGGRSATTGALPPVSAPPAITPPVSAPPAAPATGGPVGPGLAGPSSPPAPLAMPFGAQPGTEHGGPESRTPAGAGSGIGPGTGGFGGGPGGFGGGPHQFAADSLVTGPVGGIGGGAAGRNLPAWSDLTGASGANGSHGANGSTPYPPIPGPLEGRAGGPDGGFAGGSEPAAGAGGPLPQRRATQAQPDDDQVGGLPPRIPRQVSASPEITRPSAWGEDGPDAASSVSGTTAGTGLESAAPGARTGDGDVTGAGPVDERTVATPILRPAPAGDQGMGIQPDQSAGVPPAWPPVPDQPPAATDGSVPATDHDGSVAHDGDGPVTVSADDHSTASPGDPSVATGRPEEFPAALDITTEIPRVPSDGEEPEPTRPEDPEAGTRILSSPTSSRPPVADVPGAGAQPAADGVASGGRATSPVRPIVLHQDDTMELPIFRELESAWFRGRGDGPAGSDALGWSDFSAAPVSGAPAGPGALSTSENGKMDSPVGPEGRSSQPEQHWESAADEGWVAATAAAQPRVSALTDAGLPKRVPMAQLVPGGVEKSNTTSANRRSPEQVRGLLSAYHRGVQRGRTRGGDGRGTGSGPGAGNSSQSGREQEA